MLGTSSAQVPLAFSSLIFRPLSRTRLANSTCPFVWGCSTHANTCIIPSSVHSFPSCWLANWMPLSYTNCFGTPKRHNIFFHTKCWILRAVIYATGPASIHFMKYSMATTRYFICRTAKGNGPRISIPQVWNGQGL